MTTTLIPPLTRVLLALVSTIFLAAGLTAIATQQAQAQTTTIPTGPTVATGNGFACAIAVTGAVECWGQNLNGQLGRGNTSNTSVDTSTPAPTGPLPAAATQIAAGQNHVCALLEGGGVHCWGQASSGQTGTNQTTGNVTSPTAVTGLAGPVAQIAAGNTSTCATLESGQVMCWGNNQYGQLGNGETEHSPVPVFVEDITDATSVAVGLHHACAVSEDGSVRCWGRNNFRNLGDTTDSDSPVPVDVTVLDEPARQVVTGNGFTCALLESDEVRCWGNNGNGQLGMEPPSSVPVPEAQTVEGLTDIPLALSTSGNASQVCAVLADETVRCWGNNITGQLGNGESGFGEYSAAPVDVIDLADDPVGVFVGSNFTCAVFADHSVQCWGNNNQQQLGEFPAGGVFPTAQGIDGVSDVALPPLRQLPEEPDPEDPEPEAPGTDDCTGTSLGSLGSTACVGVESGGSLGSSGSTFTGGSGDPDGSLADGSLSSLQIS